MKQLIVFFVVLISNQFCLSQNDELKLGIKKIVSTEIFRQLYNDGKYHNSIIETNEYYYDKNGKKLKNVRIVYRNSQPKTKNSTKYFYNQNNKIDYTISIVDEDSTTFKTFYQYKDKRLIKKYFNYIKDEKEYKFEENYIYNSKNKLTDSYYTYSERSTNINKEDYIVFFSLKEKYDKKERTFEMDYTKSDTVYRHNIYRYKWKEKGILKNEKEYNKYNKLLSKIQFDYSFDKKGNWIKRKAYKNKSLYKSIYREIEYYN